MGSKGNFYVMVPIFLNSLPKGDGAPEMYRQWNQRLHYICHSTSVSSTLNPLDMSGRCADILSHDNLSLRRFHQTAFCHAAFYHATICHGDIYSRRQFVTMTIFLDDKLSIRQFVTKTIRHDDNSSPRQFVTKTIHHDDYFSIRQFITTTICH